MTLENLLQKVPALQMYLDTMPEGLKRVYLLRTYQPKTIIQQKDTPLDHFGFVLKGRFRIINELPNGEIYVIEKYKPINFVGDVAILAGKENSSVTIEAVTETTVLYFPRSGFERWIFQDLHILCLLTANIANQLYSFSYTQGYKLFHSSQWILLEYLLKYADSANLQKNQTVKIRKTRQDLYEECGITVKTLNRTIKKLTEKGIVSMDRGKMTMSYNQYCLGKELLSGGFIK